MTDQRRFDDELARAFERYGARMPVEVDAPGLAATIAAGAPPSTWRSRLRDVALRGSRGHHRLLAASATLVAAIVIVGVAGLTAAWGSGDVALGPGAATEAPVEARMTLDRAVFQWDGGFDESVFAEVVTTDAYTRGTLRLDGDEGWPLDFGDDRLDGTLVGDITMGFAQGRLDLDGFDSPRQLMFIDGLAEITNDRGAWSGTISGAGIAEPTTSDRMAPSLAATNAVRIALSGSGDYQGLRAIITVTFDEPPEATTLVFPAAFIDPEAGSG